MEGKPNQVLFKPNSDTRYASVPLDLRGPVTVEPRAGPLIDVANDFNFRWVIDTGLPDPEAGKGGKHIVLPPDRKGEVPAGYHTGRSTTYGVFLILRSLPLGGDTKAAVESIQTVKVQAFSPPAGRTWPKWTNVTDKSFGASPVNWEKTLKFREILHRNHAQIIDTEPAYEPYRNNYGEPGVLGIVSRAGRLRRTIA
jgi:hypothetical protein